MMLGASVLGNVEAATYDFSYVGEVSEYLGIQKAETYDVAIFLPGDLFEGFSIKEINALVNSGGGVSVYADPSLWLSGTLDLNGNDFTPDIASYSSEFQADGKLSAKLPEDYVITASGVYVGYSFTVKKLNTASQFPMAIGDCADPNAMFCRTNKTMPQWSNLGIEMECGACVSVVLESDAVAANSVTITSITDPVYMEIGKPAGINIGLSSFASEPVASVDIEYMIDGVAGSSHIDLPEEVPAGLNRKFEVAIDLPAFDHKFSGEYSFAVTKVNGKENESDANEKNTFIAAMPYYPAHQTLIEEYTGTWCGWCPGGYAMLEYIRRTEPDYVVAAFHNNDSMQVTTNYPSSIPGFPRIILDRYYSVDPVEGSGKYTGKAPLMQDIKELNALPTVWEIEVSHSWEGDDTLIATANVRNMIGFTGGDYKIAYLLVADGLTGGAQTNNYASRPQSSNYVEELNQFCRGGEYGKSKVTGLIFNDVVISTTGIYGVEQSVPSSLEADEQATHSLTFDLSKIKKSLIPDRNKLRIIAALVDGSGKVLNCAKNEINDYIDTGVDGILSSEGEAPVEYYNLSGVKVAEPSNGIFIRKQGSKTEKVIIRD